MSKLFGDSAHGWRVVALAVLVVAALALAPAAQADEVVDLNPADGVINPTGGGCTTPPYAAPCPTDTVGPFTILSYFAPIPSLLSDTVPSLPSGTWFLSSGNYFQETVIYLTGGGTFTVESFQEAGCTGTVQALDATGITVIDGYGGNCLGLGTVTANWTGVSYLTFSANGSGEPCCSYLGDIVIEPTVSAAPEPEIIPLFGTGLTALACLGLVRRRNGA